MSNQSILLMCPICGSAAVSSQAPLISVEPVYECSSCGWEGTHKEIVAAPFEHELGSDAAILDAMASDLRVQLAKDMGKLYLGYLIKWGFVSKPDPKLLARYLKDISDATLKSIMQTRLELERENIDGKPAA